MEREFDIIIFGASGFTGELTVEETAKIARQENLRWAVAGRNLPKIQQILVEVEKRLNTDHDMRNIQIFQVDIDDMASLELMCEKTRVLVNCVGPYTRFGEPVVKACLKRRTHAVDMTVEGSYLNHIMLRYHEEAKSREVYIISSCGIGWAFLEMAVQLLQENYEGRINRIDVFIKPELKFRSVHFATWDSIINMNSSGLGDILASRQKIYSELMNRTKSKFEILGLSYPMKVSKEVNGIGFLVPSVMHPVQLGLDRKEEAFNEQPVKISYYWTLHSMGSLIFIIIGLFLVCLLPFQCGRRLLTKYPTFFSCGLVKKSTLIEKTKDISNLNFTAVVTGRNLQDRQNRNICGNSNKIAVLYGSSPPSYKTSAICLVHAALTVLQETGRLPKSGGVYTPLTAFAKTSLPSRLQRNGISYKEKEEKKTIVHL